MCGICGIINFNGSPVTESGLKSMMGIMKHRGPDDEGIFIENNAGLGFVRLSILDLSPAGHQPMISSNNRYVLVFNGEIFNYIELREELVRKGFVFQSNTDSEVLLNSYILWGEDCLHRFNGMWAFVIYDRQERKLFGSRDRYGIKPFYYHFDASAFLFASEIPPITSHFAKKPLQNDQAIFDYLLFNRTDQDATTFYKDVLKLQHGCKFTLELPPETIAADYHVNNHQPGKLKISKWYTLIENLKEPFKGPDEFRESLSASIGLRLRSDVPVGICFSGGLDSSTIISLLLKDYRKDDINTFSTAYGKGLLGDETEYINEYREVLKNMYFTYPNASTLENDIPRLIRAHNEPIPSTSPYAQFKVMELAKEHVVVTLDGQGADELLAGYEYFYGYYYKELLRKGNFPVLLKEIVSYLNLYRNNYALETFVFFMLPAKLKTQFRQANQGFLDHQFYKKYVGNSIVSDKIYGSKDLRQALIDHFEYKLEHLLKWEDKNSMWFSIEARTPYLDHELVERSLSLDSSWKIRNGWTKHIQREAMKGLMPEKIRKRKIKLGFENPDHDWFRNDYFRGFVMNIIESESFAARKIIDPNKVKNLFKAHLEHKANHAWKIWKWINLELWFREFID